MYDDSGHAHTNKSFLEKTLDYWPSFYLIKALQSIIKAT